MLLILCLLSCGSETMWRIHKHVVEFARGAWTLLWSLGNGFISSVSQINLTCMQYLWLPTCYMVYWIQDRTKWWPRTIGKINIIVLTLSKVCTNIVQACAHASNCEICRHSPTNGQFKAMMVMGQMKKVRKRGMLGPNCFWTVWHKNFMAKSNVHSIVLFHCINSLRKIISSCSNNCIDRVGLVSTCVCMCVERLSSTTKI